MKISVLIENTAKNGFTAEHGLSLFIEHNNKTILLDAGSSEAFYENAEKLEIKPETADICVLSHGHYDHSGGFTAVLERNDSLKIYANKNAFGNFLSGNGGLHFIGIPDNVRQYKDRFILTDGVTKLDNDIYLVPHSAGISNEIGRRDKLYVNSENEPDKFSHEQSLVIDTKKGLVIFNSCSHGGVENIDREVRETYGGKRIYAYIGGLHMKGTENGRDICVMPQNELDKLCQFIKNEDITHIYTGHCTGTAGLDELKKRLDNVHTLTSGLCFEL